jgi:hypothetical protein
MGDKSKVLRLPVPSEKVTCHLTIPRFDYVIGLEEDTSSGLTAMAAEMERVADQFDNLAQVFEECPEATYSSSVLFCNGHLTFEFQIPRVWAKRLRELGWSSEDLDVEGEGTVPSESDFSDA